jgi:4-hydroxymandelate oxidase
MKLTQRQMLSRRAVLGGLALLPFAGSRAPAQPIPASQEFQRAPAPITAADQVLDVMEFEALARNALPPAHFGFIATGADDDRTVLRNHDAFSHYEIRAHRFSDLTHLTTATQVLGKAWATPIYLSAVSAMRAFHPEGETAVAGAASSRSVQMMLSMGTSSPVEAVVAARGGAVWQQLYPTDDWAVTTSIIRRARKAGCPDIVLTADSRGGRNNETLTRAIRADSRHCTDCHIGGVDDSWRHSPMFAGLDVSRVTTLVPPDLSPAFLDKLRAEVKGRLLIKGVVTEEDARLAVEHGADAIIVSNHGGRNEETLRATVDCLPEVAAGTRGRIPVFLDGGIRRGTDVFKALALGATAVGLGRPQAWGLAAFGRPGIEAVIDILNRELSAIMRQAGTPTIADIRSSLVVRSSYG